MPADTAQSVQAAPAQVPAEPRPATALPPVAQPGAGTEIVVSGELKAPPGDPLARAHAMNEGAGRGDDDLLPSF